MKLPAKLLAVALSLGIVGAAPALAQPGPDHGRHNAGRHDNGRHNGWHKQDRRYRGHGYRGHRGRRVCRTERRHGHRVTRCFYR